MHITEMILRFTEINNPTTLRTGKFDTTPANDNNIPIYGANDNTAHLKQPISSISGQTLVA